MPWAPDYIQVSDLKSYLRIDPADTQDDAQLAIAITAASRAIDNTTHRQFGQVAAAEPRQYTARLDQSRAAVAASGAAVWGRWVVDTDDFQDAAGLTVTTPDGTVDLFTKQPVNAAAVAKPWTRIVIDPAAAVLPKGIESEITVTAKFGWSTVPVTIKQACLLQAARLFKRQDAPFGVAGSPQEGSEMRLLARIDPDVAVTLRPYMRLRLSVG